ncbi:MAG: MATE family efflux transporter [Butyrivibrio sp.]
MKQYLKENKYIHMTTAPVKRLVCSLAIPSIISMLVTAFYNMADTLFVGHISTQATGAIGVVFSYMALVQAVSFFFGHGCGNFISRSLGAKRVTEAKQMAATGFFSALFAGIILGMAGTIFIKPLLIFFGATETILPDAIDYIRYILIATPFIMGAFVLNNIMRLQGNANKAVIGIASGAVLNVVLDPILIFGFKMGISGAGIATAISQIIGFVILLFLSGSGDGIKIRWKNFTPKGKYFVEIFAGGFPSLARQGLGSISTICLNNVAGAYGDSAIAAFSVVSRIGIIFSSALIGFGQGFQPVCGFNYGAGKYDRVKEAFWFCVKVATVAMTLIGIVIFIFAEPIVCLFRDNDAELVKIAVKALRFQCFSMPLMGFIVLSNMCLQNTRKTFRATIIAMARQGLMLIPAIYILNAFWGILGMQISQCVADILSFMLSIPLMATALKEMKL